MQRAGRLGDARWQRTAVRAVHLTVAVLLGCYVYAPPGFLGWLRPFLMFVGVPVAVLTGVYLWKQAALRALVRRLLAPGTAAGRQAVSASVARERADG